MKLSSEKERETLKCNFIRTMFYINFAIQTIDSTIIVYPNIGFYLHVLGLISHIERPEAPDNPVACGPRIRSSLVNL